MKNYLNQNELEDILNNGNREKEVIKSLKIKNVNKLEKINWDLKKEKAKTKKKLLMKKIVKMQGQIKNGKMR